MQVDIRHKNHYRWEGCWKLLLCCALLIRVCILKQVSLRVRSLNSEDTMTYSSQVFSASVLALSLTHACVANRSQARLMTMRNGVVVLMLIVVLNCMVMLPQSHSIHPRFRPPHPFPTTAPLRTRFVMFISP